MHTNRFAIRRNFRGLQLVSQTLHALNTLKKKEGVRFQPKPKLRVVPPPADTPKAPHDEPLTTNEDDHPSFPWARIDHFPLMGPGRIPSKTIWQAITDAVQRMPKSTPRIQNFSRAAHVYCGIVLNRRERHSIQRYVHAQITLRLGRIWRNRHAMTEDGLFYLATAIILDIERHILAVFEEGTDTDDLRPHGRRVRRVTVTEGSGRAAYIPYEQRRKNEPHILTVQDQRRYNQQKRRKHTRESIRRPYDRGWQKKRYFS